MTSGTGSVRTMWLEATVRRRRSGASRPEAALSATIAAPARTRPEEVRAVVPCSARTRDPSKIRTPRAASRSRRPNASRAGWTVAPVRTSTAPRNSGESQRARVSEALSSTTSAPSIAPRPTPSCAGAAHTSQCGAARYQASTPCSSHQAPIARTLASDCATTSAAAAAP
jgi:hypothetical protein